MPWEKASVPDESQSCRKLQNKNNSLREEIQSCLLRDILLQRADGTLCSLEKLVSGKRSILAFLEIGAEPTEHVLNEVLALEKERKRKFQRNWLSAAFRSAAGKRPAA